jgi:hypothetical protein
VNYFYLYRTSRYRYYLLHAHDRAFLRVARKTLKVEGYCMIRIPKSLARVVRQELKPRSFHTKSTYTNCTKRNRRTACARDSRASSPPL